MADILVVEDDPAVASVLALLLETEGYTTRWAANGQEGLAMLHERRPDLTISDIEMPVLDGPGMANRILIEDQGMEKIPLILISGFPDIGLFAGRIGTPYFISKPFVVEALVGLVKTALEERVPPNPATVREKGRNQ